MSHQGRRRGAGLVSQASAPSPGFLEENKNWKGRKYSKYRYKELKLIFKIILLS
jgi:hypothetical protein